MVRESVQDESLETTRNLAEQLSQSVNQFAEGVSEMLERAQAEEDELQEEMESLIEQLEELDERQQALIQELSDARADDPVYQELANAWIEIQRLSGENVRLSKENVQYLRDGRGFRYGSVRTIESVGQQVQDIQHAVVTRDAGE